MALHSLSPAEKFLHLPKEEQDAFLASLTEDEAQALQYDYHGFWLRPKQILPDDGFIKLILAGRAFGKTYCSTAWLLKLIESGAHDRIALVGADLPSVREVQIEGPSGLLRRSPPWLTPKYVKMPRPKLVYPNGVTLLGFSGEDPESLRGFSGTAAAMDEWCAMRYPEETLDMLLMCLREGHDPQLLITTTPKPIPILRKLVKDPTVYVVTGNTWENSSNLPPQYLAMLKDKYEGTILGRQELEAEILDDNPHAMFRRIDFDATRVVFDVRNQNVTEERAKLIASMEEIVVAIDPSTKDKKSSDECGIIVAGRRGKEYYLISDESDVMKPREWAEKGVRLYRQYGASWIVIETNQGGDMVVDTIRTVDDTVPIKPIHATKAKAVRAQPISSLSQQHRIHHIGLFPKLEDELCVWEPGLGMPSPNRYDAYCYALLYLCGGAETWALSADLWEWIRTRGQVSAM